MNIFENIGSLILYLILLAFVAISLNAAIAYYRLSVTEQGVITFRMQVQHLFAGTNYSGLDNELALKAGIVPDTFVNDDTLMHTWGGAVTVEALPAEAAFSISLAEIPQNSCSKLALFQPGGWTRVEVNGGTVDDKSVPVVVNACGNNETSTITFVSR